MQRDPIDRNVKNVLIIATGTLGDIILSIAAFEAIRQYHNNSHIVLLTEPEVKRFLANCPYIDEVVTNWRTNNISEQINYFRQMQSAGFDIVYDLIGNEETEEIYKKFLLKKPKWSGIAYGCSHPHLDRSRDKMHFLDRVSDQLWLCGIGPEDGYPIGASPLPNLNWYINIPDLPPMGKASQGIDTKFVLFAPEVNSLAIKGWPPSKFIELGNKFVEIGITPVLVGSSVSYSLGNEIRAGIPSAIDLIGRLDIFGFMGLAKDAELVIASDGDLGILCGVIGVPTVSLINPRKNSLRQAAPRGRNTVSLVSRDINEVSIQQVMQACKAVSEIEF